MRAASLLVPSFSLLCFYACGDDSAPAQIGSPDVDASIDGSQSATDASGSSDASSTDDGSVGDAAKDAARDGGDGGDGGVAVADASVESGIPNDYALFDETPGANTYGGLNATNWVTSGTFIDASAGTQWFGSGNGNNNSFVNLSIKKELGGVVQNQPYTVSFYIAKHETALGAVQLSNFAKLRIGGLAGTVSWTTTPIPPGQGGWVQWVGTYTPDATDVGGPFYFEATFELPGKTTVSFDGPIRAIP